MELFLGVRGIWVPLGVGSTEGGRRRFGGAAREASQMRPTCHLSRASRQTPPSRVGGHPLDLTPSSDTNAIGSQFGNMCRKSAGGCEIWPESDSQSSRQFIPTTRLRVANRVGPQPKARSEGDVYVAYVKRTRGRLIGGMAGHRRTEGVSDSGCLWVLCSVGRSLVEAVRGGVVRNCGRIWRSEVCFESASLCSASDFGAGRMAFREPVARRGSAALFRVPQGLGRRFPSTRPRRAVLGGVAGEQLLDEVG